MTDECKRKPRNIGNEIYIKSFVMNDLESRYGDYSDDEAPLIKFCDIPVHFLIKYSSFHKKLSRWFWGVPRYFWDDWYSGNSLALVFETDLGGYSVIYLDYEKTKKLIDLCSVDKNGEKKINMRISSETGRMYIQEWKNLGVEDYIVKLPVPQNGLKMK